MIQLCSLNNRLFVTGSLLWKDSDFRTPLRRLERSHLERLGISGCRWQPVGCPSPPPSEVIGGGNDALAHAWIPRVVSGGAN